MRKSILVFDEKTKVLDVDIEQAEWIMNSMACTEEEAKEVLHKVFLSLEYKKSNPEVGPGFDVTEIKEAMENIGCNAHTACNVLHVFQWLDQFNKSISYLEIKSLMEKFSCTAEDALDTAIVMKEKNISLSQHQLIKTFKEHMNCSLVEAVMGQSRWDKVSSKNGYSIDLDAIKEAMDKAGCKTPEEAVLLADIVHRNEFWIDYDEYNNIRKTPGFSFKSEEVIEIYNMLKDLENNGRKRSFTLNKIPGVMKEMDCDARTAISMLFAIQGSEMDAPFLLPQIKKIKKLTKVSVKRAFELLTLVLAFRSNEVSKEEMPAFFKKLEKGLSANQLTELIKATGLMEATGADELLRLIEQKNTEDLETGMREMKIAPQETKSSSSAAANTGRTGDMSKVAYLAKKPEPKPKKESSFGGFEAGFLDKKKKTSRKKSPK